IVGLVGATGSARSGNSQLLTDLDLVRILEDVAIGLEDLWIQLGVAVIFLRDLRKGVALLHHVVLRIGIVGAGTRGFALVFHRSTSRLQARGRLLPLSDTSETYQGAISSAAPRRDCATGLRGGRSPS